MRSHGYPAACPSCGHDQSKKKTNNLTIGFRRAVEAFLDYSAMRGGVERPNNCPPTEAGADTVARHRRPGASGAIVQPVH